MIDIFLNGERVKLEVATTLAAALKHWGYNRESIATALNETFIPRDLYNSTQVKNGDSIEVVSAMQGG